MGYTIQYNGHTDTYFMDDQSENFIGCHLMEIARLEKIKESGISESHMLAILGSHGIEVNLLDEDGSRMEW